MAKKEKIQYAEYTEDGQRYLECRECGTFVAVGSDVTATTCHECVREMYEKDFPYTPPKKYKGSGRPRGWAFMKEYVDKDGNVYHRGIEQPKLKGTLKPSVIKTKPPKKRLSKKEKERIRVDALAKIHKLKKDLGKAKFKKDIKKINSEIRKLNIFIM